MQEYKDPVIGKLIEKLEAEGPSELVGKYHYGDVLIAPQEELPICSIAKDASVITAASNAEDDHRFTLVLNVLINWSRDLDQSFDLQAGTQQLYELIEGRDSDYSLRDNTILKVLRKYQSLDTNLWLAVGPSEAVEINYGLGIERRGAGIFSLEGVIRLNARLIINRDTS